MWDVYFRRWIDLLFWWAPKKEGAPPPKPEQAPPQRAQASEPRTTERRGAEPRAAEPSTRPAPEPAARRPAQAAGGPGPVEPTAAQPEKTVAPAVPDDLTMIKGIGPAMQNKLRALGITTFADLAGADPDALLRQLKGSQPLSRGRVNEWTVAARKRAQT